MKEVKIYFRLKHDRGNTERSWKVFTTQRIKGLKHPKQIHIGYIKERFPIPPYAQQRITEKLRQKWSKLHGVTEVFIDWEKANDNFKIKTSRIEITQTKEDWKKMIILEALTKEKKYSIKIGGHIFHTLPEIADISGFSESMTSKYLKKLVKSGYVDTRSLIHMDKGKSRVYSITPEGVKSLNHTKSLN